MVQMSLLILVFIFILFLLRKRPQNHIPSPPTLPLIGNLHNLIHPSPQQALTDLAARYGPIMRLKLGFVSFIVVSSAEAARQVMQTHDSILCNRPKVVAVELMANNHSDIAFAPYGSYWRQLKKICILQLATAKSLDSTRFIREEEVKLLVETISKSLEPITLVEMLFSMNHNIITRIMFDDTFDDEKRFRSLLKEGVSLAVGFQIGDFYPSLEFIAKLTRMNKRLEECVMEVRSIMEHKIKHRINQRKIKQRQHQRECLIDILLGLQDSGDIDQPFNTENIKSVLLDLITGATDNSTNIVEWAMVEMLRDPSVMEKAQTEVRKVISEKVNPIVEETDLPKLNYLKMVVKEILRIHPPVPLLLPRESTKRCMINGYNIPPKSRIIINYWAIARDPANWKDPDVFNPERFLEEPRDYRGNDFEFIPFGAGRRICPGISLGIINTELTLASLLYHFDWKLPEGESPQDIDMRDTYGVTCFKTCSLQVVPSIRFPVST